MKKRVLIIACAAALAVLSAVLLWPGADVPAPSEALLAAAEGLDDITVSARLDAAERRLWVTQTLRLANRTGQNQSAAVLRTWVNAFQSEDTSPLAADEDTFAAAYPGGFSPGVLLLTSAHVNGETVLASYRDDAQTVLAVPVPGGWAADASITLDLAYCISIPEAAHTFGVWNDVFALGNVFAAPAVWEDGAFRTDAYAPVGDPCVTDCADWHISLELPRGYVCAAGAALEEKDGITSFDLPAARHVGFAVSARYQTAQAVRDGVLIRACALDSASANRLLTIAQKALACYAKHCGAYPRPVFTLAEVPGGDAALTGLSLLASDAEYDVAQSVAHQWWGEAVGSDGWNQPWQSDAMCAYAMLTYAADVHGAGAREELERTRTEPSLRVTVSSGVTPGAPLEVFSDAAEYRLVVCDRGAACMLALERTVQGGLDPFLRAYFARYAFRRASRADFEALLREVTGEDLAPLLRDYLDTNILN